MSLDLNRNSDIAVKRIGSSEYVINIPNDKLVYVKFNNHRESVDHENEEFYYNLAALIGKDIVAKKEISSFSFMDRKWDVQINNKSTPFLHKITNFVHDQVEENGVLRLLVNKSNQSILESPDSINYTAELDREFEMVVKDFNIKNAKENNILDCAKEPTMILCSDQELAEVVRGKCIYSELLFEDKMKMPLSSLPFSVLSSLAFQRYESEFIGKDHFNPKDCNYCLQLRDEILFLVPNRKPFNDIKDRNRETMLAFVKQVIERYGKDKFEVICHRYKIDLKSLIESGIPLTPELVYRINIGLNNFETDDLNQFFLKLPEFKDKIENEIRSNPEKSLVKLMESLNGNPFTIFQMAGIINAIKSKWNEETPDQDSLLLWLDLMTSYRSVDQMAPQHLNDLMEVFSKTSDESRQGLTGKDIYFSIKQAYTTAEKLENKPWIDDQEFAQVYPDLQEMQEWPSYFEKLSHVISKKHLFHKHPTLGYKLGTIIPAPLTEDGGKRWYKVTQAVHNGYGMVCYTLVSLGNDSTLPDIKLYRSTSTNNYATFGKKSLRSDVNLLNPAGYEGRYRTAEYEMPLIHQQTIPLWVAYQMEGENLYRNANPQNQSSLFGVYNTLADANSALLDSVLEDHHQMTFTEVIKKHDGIINTLYSTGSIGSRLFHKIRIDLFEQETQKQSPKSRESLNAGIKESANDLIKQLMEFKNKIYKNKDRFSNQLMFEIDELIVDLSSHVLTDHALQVQRKEVEKLNNAIFNKASFLQKDAAAAFGRKDLDSAHHSLLEWMHLLDDYAKTIGEDLSSKTPKDIAFTGHSLGGGHAQIFMDYYLFKQNRVPCPGKKCSAVVFDPPGVQNSDNERFKKFIINHGPLLNKLNITVQLFHQHEKGDPVPSAGVQLGTATGMQEAAQLLNNLDFKLVLMKRKPNAVNKTIAEAHVAHETQFRGGQKGIDYEEEEFDPFHLGLLKYHEQIRDQGILDPKAKGNELRNKSWQLPMSPGWADWLQSNRLVNNGFRIMSGEHWIQHEERMIPRAI